MNPKERMSGTSLKLINVFIEGDQQIGRDSGVIGLDAETQTVDPDSTSETLTCSWSCEVQLGGSCDSAVNRQSIFCFNLRVSNGGAEQPLLCRNNLHNQVCVKTETV